MPNETTPRIALITGANKGIGLQVATELAAAGCTVLLGVRNSTAGEAAAEAIRATGAQAIVLPIDLTQPETAHAAAATIEQRFGHLDILVNNAGIADKADGPSSTANVAAVERTFQTNFFGTVAVTQAMLPLLRKSAHASIVNVSSGLGSLTLSAQPGHFYATVPYIGYCASKAALNMFTVKLAHELRDTTIRVNSSDPGYTATDLNGHSGHQTIQQGAAETVRLALLPQDGPTGGYFETTGPVPW